MSVLEIEKVTTARGVLHTAAGIAARYGVSEKIIRESVDANFMPHYRVRGLADPLFDASESKEWIANNLIEHSAGRKLPESHVILTSDAPVPLIDVPSALKAIIRLREIAPTSFCGIYFLCLGEDVVYVGQSKNVFARLSGHREKDFDRVFFVRVAESQLDAVEMKFIKALNPSLNRQGNNKYVAVAAPGKAA